MFNRLTHLITSILWKIKLRHKWRELNKHNTTKLEIVPSNQEFFSKVKVGIGTYGPIRAIYSYASAERLEIGNYCSIGSGTTFIMGSEHGYKGISTFPFKVKVLGFLSEAETKGPILVDDDVWFGENVLVLSGVKIGKGAVIAACSVVVKDIPPYAIVGGNPARIIKYRFSKEIIDKLLIIDWSKIDISVIRERLDSLYEELNENNVDEVINNLKLK